MNNPKFYIYGVPDGFNMLSGTSDEILYFQLFYDTSKKGTEMRINRKANGETVYSYLIYNLVSCKGREGAFLGMSIAFSNFEYCNNPTELKKLFELVYNELILKADDKDRIIAKIEGGNAIGRFCIPKFSERQEMCDKIGRIIINNIVGELAQYIVRTDNTFDNSKEGRILTLPFDTDNTSVVQSLRNYTWVSLSTEYKPVQKENQRRGATNQNSSPIAVSQDLLSVHYINDMSKKVTTYKDFIIQGLKGQVSISEISAKKDEINQYLNTIEEYASRQPELVQLKEQYMSIYKDIIGLKPQNPRVLQMDESQSSNLPNNNGTDYWLKLIKPHISKIAIGGCSILVLILMIILRPSGEESQNPGNKGDSLQTERKDPKTDDASSTKFDEQAFEDCLAKADFKEAWSMTVNINDSTEQKLKQGELQRELKSWSTNQSNENENNLSGLKELKKKMEAYKDFYKYYKSDMSSLEEEINELEEKLPKDKSKNLDSGNSSQSVTRVFHIYKADSNYTKDKIVTPNNKVIECRMMDYFVVEGATAKPQSDPIEVVPANDVIRIRAKKMGSHTVKLNEVEYTFNVKPKQ